MRPFFDTTSLAVIGMRIKNIATTEWNKVLADYKPAAIQRNEATYASKYNRKVRKRFGVPPGTRREIASAFYQLKIGHGYLKDHLYRITKSDSPLCSCDARQTSEHVLLSCKWLKDALRTPGPFKGCRDWIGGRTSDEGAPSSFVKPGLRCRVLWNSGHYPRARKSGSRRALQALRARSPRTSMRRGRTR